MDSPSLDSGQPKKRSRSKKPADPKPSEAFAGIMAQAAASKMQEDRADRVVLVGKAFSIYGQLIECGIVPVPNFDQRTDADIPAVVDRVQVVIDCLADALARILDC